MPLGACPLSLFKASMGTNSLKLFCQVLTNRVLAKRQRLIWTKQQNTDPNLKSGFGADTTKRLDYSVQELSAHRQMSGCYDNVIVQFALPHHPKDALIYGSLVRDGGGPLKTPVFTMLILEDVIAYVQTPYGIYLGTARVTMFRSIDLAEMTAIKPAQVNSDFTDLNVVIFIDYPDHDVSSSLYQKFELV